MKELLALVGLPDSGRQVSRAALRRAAAAHRDRARDGHLPGLLLLDEPLSALDARVRMRLRGEIRSLQRRVGITTILVTHDQEEALSMADRIVVMNQGVIEQIGTPTEVYREARDAVRGGLRRQDQPAAGHALGGNPLQVGGGAAMRGATAASRRATPAPLFRPEDVLVRGVNGSHAESADAVIEKVEFLGGLSRVTFRVSGIEARLLLRLVAEPGAWFSA